MLRVLLVLMSESRAVIVGIDALAAIDSNRYADPIKREGAWIAQIAAQTT